ncbi:hypothetical protein V2G26_020304 [Clonostachys chloroleuca]
MSCPAQTLPDSTPPELRELICQVLGTVPVAAVWLLSRLRHTLLSELCRKLNLMTRPRRLLPVMQSWQPICSELVPNLSFLKCLLIHNIISSLPLFPVCSNFLP